MKTATPVAIEVGYDAAKKVKGRKRHLLVDTLGLVLMVVVTAASVPERGGAKLLLAQLEHIRHWFSRLVVIWVDGGYSGIDFSKWVMDTYRWVFKTVLRTAQVKGFVPIPQRWKVERTLNTDITSKRSQRYSCQSYQATFTGSLTQVAAPDRAMASPAEQVW